MQRFRYDSDLTGGSLMVRESRIIADLMLRNATPDMWQAEIQQENRLQKRSPVTARRQAQSIRKRLERLDAPFWRVLRDGDDELATQAFQCLVYLNRYNESTPARMRTEYVIPLTAKLNTYVDKLEQDRDTSTSATETKRLEKEITGLHKQQAELTTFDEKLRYYADQRISLDLDDGVKVNYGKFGDLLAEVKFITGEKPKVN